jgi:ubiquitin-protein ligase
MCIDICKDTYSWMYTLAQITKGIHTLIIAPNPESPANGKLCELRKDD